MSELLIQIFAGYWADDDPTVVHFSGTYNPVDWMRCRSELIEYDDSVTYSVMVF